MSEESIVVVVVGQCRYCHCTAAQPCVDYAQNECGWANKRQDLCTNGKCLIAADRGRKAAKRARREELERQVEPIRDRIWAAKRLGAGKRMKGKKALKRRAA